MPEGISWEKSLPMIRILLGISFSKNWLWRASNFFKMSK